MVEFRSFQKIPRLLRDIIITEKIDGANVQVYIVKTEQKISLPPGWVWQSEDFTIYAGNRSQFITLIQDMYGFAKWVQEHGEELLKLGIGRHFGEWWGEKINRTYGLKERRFSLFNVKQWQNDTVRPKCCHVVPKLYEGPFSPYVIEMTLQELRMLGSKAVENFMRPEGIVLHHIAGNCFFKQTIEKDEEPKRLLK